MPRGATAIFNIAAHTDIGPRKKSNQDSCCAIVAQTPIGEAALLCVCDGVGGLALGELASGSVVNWLVQWFENRFPLLAESVEGDGSILFERVRNDWESGLFAMNDALRNHGRKEEVSLGTTCTAILLVCGRYIIVHVGDTRVYRFFDGRMDLLTFDQTWVAQEVARGNIPVEKARTHPKRNVILQSVGTQNDLQPVFLSGAYALGDTFMVCCDGFRNELFDDELLSAFGQLQNSSERDMVQTCEGMVQLALGRGERDNVTVVALCCQPDAESADSDISGAPVMVGESDCSPTVHLDDPDDPKTTILAQIERDGGAA